jgi:hypothetical protein
LSAEGTPRCTPHRRRLRAHRPLLPAAARPADHNATKHNYLLLGIAVFQFPFIAWLSRLPGVKQA